MKIFKKRMSSLNRYIILNMLAAFALSIFIVIGSVSIGSEQAMRPFNDKFFAEYPQFANLTEEEFTKVEREYAEAWEKVNVEMLPSDEWKMTMIFASYALIGGFGGALLTIGLFVFKIRRRIVRELNRFDTALGTIPVISGDSSETIEEIHSGIREFDQICLRFNQITDRLKESEIERKRLEGQQRKMIADISHDLKTPITVIQGYAKAVRDNVADDVTKEKYLDAICRKAENVTELINTFHEYSKLEHPDYVFNLVQGDLCEFFREYLAGKYQDLSLSGYDMEAELPEHSVPFAFDRQQLQRVFENLLSNALRHNPPGTTLYAQMFEQENAIILRLGDNGKGIPPEIQDKLFEPFVVGSESRSNSQGSGLGLAISKRIVEGHHGSICLKKDAAGVMHTMYEIVFTK